MSRQYNAVVVNLRAELSRQAPRPLNVMAILATIEGFEDARNISPHQLRQFNVIEIIGDALIHIRGWPQAMVIDAQEKNRILNAY